METLFELPKEIKQTDKKCKNCKFFTWIEYRSGKKFFYCNIRKNNRTFNHKLKIKANMVTCQLYENK